MKKHAFMALGAGWMMAAVVLMVLAFQGNTDGDLKRFRTGYTTAKGRYLGAAFICLLAGTATLKVGWSGRGSGRK